MNLTANGRNGARAVALSRHVIELPLVERATAEAAGPAVETLPLVGARRVLVVDDELEIAHMLTAPRAWTRFVTDGTTSF